MALITIAAAGYGYIRQQNLFEINDARHDMETIADLKATQLVQWRKERLQEARSVYANAMVSHRVKDYLNGIDKNRALREIHNWMDSLYNQAGYNSMLLFLPDGKIVTSISELGNRQQPQYKSLINETIRKRDVIFSDFYRDNNSGTCHINLSIPIMYQSGTHADCIAVLVIDINPFRDLYPNIRHWPTPSRTAEALLVERDGNKVRFLSQLRYQAAPVLTFTRPLLDRNMPAVRAALGQEGVIDGLDYRGVQVVAAIRNVADSPWTIITKIDTEEILEPVAERTYHVVAICLSTIMAIGLAIGLGWSRKKATYLNRQYEAELKHTEELRSAERALKEAHDNLEQRVVERTEEIQKSHTLLKGLSQQIPGVMYQFRMSPDGSYSIPYASDASHDIFELNPADVCENAAPLFERIHPNHIENVVTALQESARLLTPLRSEFQIFHSEKGLRWISAESNPVLMEDGTIIWHGFASDITERKLAENELLEKRYQLDEAQRQANIGNWNWMIGNDSITWSEQLYTITGRDPKLPCITYNDQSHMYTPESWTRLDNAVKRALETGEPYEFELELIRADKAHRSCIARGEVVHDQFGTVTGLRGTLQDVTERILLERQLYQAKRLESIGQLAAGVAHEVRNPLNAILSITEALFRETEIEGNPEYEPYIQHIRTQVSRLANLMNDLLELGKPIPPVCLLPVQLYNLCRETIKLWDNSGSADKIPVLLTADPDHSDLYVIADSIKLQQTVFNLLENAAQNSPKDASIELTISLPVISDTSNPFATILITDAGTGIPESNLNRVFDPFFTGRKDGTGLGLALVKHLIDNMGGSVRLYNNSPPPGCTAELHIPRVRKEQA
ncbi:MAG: PAS domain-containing protein [Geobacteraceae bacterium]|nr:PAS domain-containing protein [Geobacteraceae bacterium]